MPFQIVRDDITHIHADAIVNTANPKPIVGSGVDAGIHRKAGPQLLEARQKIGPIAIGDAAVTPAFGLDAQYVIHTVGPAWHGGHSGEERTLRSCYARSLQLAKQLRCASIAFPLISTGNYGFPKDLALQVAMDTIRGFLRKNEMLITLVVFDRDSFQLSSRLSAKITNFIDEHYIQEAARWQQGAPRFRELEDTLPRFSLPLDADDDLLFPGTSAPGACDPQETACYDSAPCPRHSAKKGFSLPLPKPKPTLAQLLQQTDAGFSETLLSLIDRTGKKDSDIYNKANVSRQHFSKIRNNPDYKPSKATAIAFAIALELDLEQTRDLIGRAGYALTNSSKFDVIIMYFIQEKNYNMFDINAALFEFDQSLLGS